MLQFIILAFLLKVTSVVCNAFSRSAKFGLAVYNVRGGVWPQVQRIQFSRSSRSYAQVISTCLRKPYTNNCKIEKSDHLADKLMGPCRFYLHQIFQLKFPSRFVHYRQVFRPARNTYYDVFLVVYHQDSLRILSEKIAYRSVLSDP